MSEGLYTHGKPDALMLAREALVARQGSGARYDAPSAPVANLSRLRLGTAYFARKLNELSDTALCLPSKRPDWSRRRVVANYALDARAIAQAMERVIGIKVDEFAETDPAALDLAETLPARALRNLVAHADIHLNVVWRDLSDAQWNITPIDVGTEDAPVPVSVRTTPGRRALTVWTSALDLGTGGHLRDVPPDFRDAVAARDLSNET